jgi:hypothetical protein
MVKFVVDLILPPASFSSLIKRRKAKTSSIKRVSADGGDSKSAKEGCSLSVFSSYLVRQLVPGGVQEGAYAGNLCRGQCTRWKS